MLDGGVIQRGPHVKLRYPTYARYGLGADADADADAGADTDVNDDDICDVDGKDRVFLVTISMPTRCRDDKS
jgi:hypothetical protein